MLKLYYWCIRTKYRDSLLSSGMTANEHITVGSNYYEKVKSLIYLDSLLINQNYIYEEIKCRLTAEISCYYSVQTLLSSRLLSKNLKIKIYKTIILPVVLYGCETWSGGKQAKVTGNRILRRIFGWEWGVEKASQWGTSYFVPFLLI